jgi:hypothetical protein
MKRDILVSRLCFLKRATLCAATLWELASQREFIDDFPAEAVDALAAGAYNCPLHKLFHSNYFISCYFTVTAITLLADILLYSC